jgi:hypothetical protein
MEKKQSSVDGLMKLILESNVELYISMQENGVFETFKEQYKLEQEIMFIYGRKFELTRERTFNDVYNETYGGSNE